MATNHPLRELWEKAGFRSAKSFCAAAGVKAYELSRMASATSPRRPTWAQLRRMAPILGVSAAELGALLLPPGDPEVGHLVDVVQERDALMTALGEARLQLTRVEADLQARINEVSTLTRQLGELSYDLDNRDEQLRVVGPLRERITNERKRRTDAEARASRLEGELHAAVARETAIRERASRELHKVRAALAEIRMESRDELSRERTRSLEKQILSGTLGAIAGAFITAAARNDDM